MERVKQKKTDKNGQLRVDKKVRTIPGKKRFVTTANADSTQNLNFVSEPMKLDMQYDYSWYYQYYMNSYGLDHYSATAHAAAAYYAHYIMVTSADYSTADLSAWMQQQGYTFNSTDKESIFDEAEKKVKVEPAVHEQDVTKTSIAETLITNENKEEENVLNGDNLDVKVTLLLGILINFCC